MNLTNDQIKHGIKLLDRLILANEQTRAILESIDNKEVKRSELVKDNDTYQYLLNHLKTLEIHD